MISAANSLRPERTTRQERTLALASRLEAVALAAGEGEERRGEPAQVGSHVAVLEDEPGGPEAVLATSAASRRAIVEALRA